MDHRNKIIDSLFYLFKEELEQETGLILTMDSSYDNNEVLNADVIYNESYIVDANKKTLTLKIKNKHTNSFISMDKDLTGRNVLINDTEYAQIKEHYKTFDYFYDIITIEGDLFSINTIEDIKTLSIRDSNAIYLYVQNGKLPSNNSFNRRRNKGILLYFNFQVISKNDKEHKQIEEYTSAFEKIYYQKYNKSFPISLDDKTITYTTSLSYDMTTQDFILKSDNAVVRIITIPILTMIDFQNYQ